MNRNVVLKGKRLTLRPLTSDDVLLIQRWSADPELQKLIGETEPMSDADAKQLLQKAREDETLLWFAIEVRATEQVIGEAGLLRIFPAWRTADLTIILGEPAARGRGYGTEAIRLLIDHAFRELRLHRLAIGVVGFNETALAFYEKIGFRREGVQRDGYFMRRPLLGLRHDEPARRRVSGPERIVARVATSSGCSSAVRFAESQERAEERDMLAEEIAKFVATIPATLEEKRGIYSIEFVIAERKAFLSKKKLTYSAKFRIHDEKRELHFTEMLRESGAGAYSGLDDSSPGFGFRRETYKTGAGPRGGTIEEQSRLFGKEYSYVFDFAKVRTVVEAAATKAGYAFAYHLTAHGL